MKRTKRNTSRRNEVEECIIRDVGRRVFQTCDGPSYRSRKTSVSDARLQLAASGP